MGFVGAKGLSEHALIHKETTLCPIYNAKSLKVVYDADYRRGVTVRFNFVSFKKNPAPLAMVPVALLYQLIRRIETMSRGAEPPTLKLDFAPTTPINMVSDSMGVFRKKDQVSYH